MSTLYSVKTKTENFNFYQEIDCPNCKRSGSLKAYMSFKRLSINFIPIFKFKKKWYIETTCCGKRYEVTPDLGKQRL